jgi:5'-nucleotidase/UDP-sugar diphosphatase
VSRKKIAGFDWRPVQINGEDSREFEADAEVAALIAPYIEKADASLKEVVGEAAGDFVFGNRLTRYQETALGNLVCDAVVWYFRSVYRQDVDFAFHNGGGIRAGLPAGPITRERVLTILPFENFLFAASLKGSDIIELFDFIATIPQGAGGWPQFSKEVSYTIDYSGGGAGRISALTINGAPVDPARTYRFCTNDYLMRGGDGYTVLTRAENTFNASLLLSYAVTEYIRAQGGSVSPATYGRIRVVGGVNAD